MTSNEELELSQQMFFGLDMVKLYNPHDVFELIRFYRSTAIFQKIQ